ncbi:MAG: glycosyltransferase [Bacteroidota bacterium]
MLYFALSVTLALGYSLIIGWYLYHWKKLPIWSPSSTTLPTTSISVLIPVRNEAATIEACLRSILAQRYPHYEIWVIDDHSEDQTAHLVKQLMIHHPQLNLIDLAHFAKAQPTQSYKKLALQVGIQHSKGALIVTTDGDCVVPPDWLQLFASFYEATGAKFIAAPVAFHQEQALLGRFQTLDFMGMMVVTGAGIQSGKMHMSNGANLAYTREAFDAVGGFQQIDHLASGDDLFLMQKIAQQFPGQIYFLKNSAATVKTAPQATLREFIQQRLRWGTKSASYQEVFITFILAVVFFFCWNILLALCFIPWLGWWALVAFGVQLGVKLVADFVFLRTAAAFFGRRDLLRSFFGAQWLHLAYIIGIGTASNLIKQYEWKGRKVR